MRYLPFHVLTLRQKVGAIFGRRYIDPVPESVREIIEATLKGRVPEIAMGITKNNELLKRLARNIHDTSKNPIRHD